jgi:hypothetical protein
MVVVPVAAWNHNLFPVVVAAMFPMIFIMVLTLRVLASIFIIITAFP